MARGDEVQHPSPLISQIAHPRVRIGPFSGSYFEVKPCRI